MPPIRNILKHNPSEAWVMLMLALVVHVFDEAVTGFLPFYNQLIPELREKLGLFFMPTFSHPVWLVGLITAVVIGLCATPLVYRGVKGIRVVTMVLGILMIANAGAHMIGSIVLDILVPGFWSSPLLLFTSSLLVYRSWLLPTTESIRPSGLP